MIPYGTRVPVAVRQVSCELSYIRILLRCIPRDWKFMKKEAKLNVISNNYTPISLTNVLCKVMESVIRDHIMKFFSRQ